MRTLETDPSRYSDAWRIPGRFTKNPDIIRFPSGRMMLVFCDVDRHWTEEISRITTLESTDNGKTWGNPRVIAAADRRKGEERWITPRLSRLRSGKLAIICDHDDYRHVHEDQDSGTWMWTSSDEGATWSKPRLTGIPGIEPDRIVELADGTLLIASHMVFRATRKLGQFVMRSTDGGETWKDLAVIASDPVHAHCEGAIVALRGGELACVMRDNIHMGYPSHVSFSGDQGRTWSKPKPLPFSGDRPYAQQLRDGRVLVTYRNQLGNRGTHAWLGDLRKDVGHQIGGVHYGDKISLGQGGLHIAKAAGATTRYVLMPPESFRSDVSFEAALKVSGPVNEPQAAMEIGRAGVRLEIHSGGIWLSRGTYTPGPPNSYAPGAESTDRSLKIDMTVLRKVRIDITAGRLQVSVDGKPMLHWVIMWEYPLRETYFGKDPAGSGESWWKEVSYQVRNETEAAFDWQWSADSGRYPDQYQIDRMLEVRANPPVAGKGTDHGYSSWLEEKDGSIYMVDYSNRDDPSPTGHLYSMRFSPADFVR